MGIGEQIAGLAQTSINQMVKDFGQGYIEAVECLYSSPELQELARTSEIEPQFLAAQIACLGVGSALGGFPGTAHQHQILLAQLVAATKPGGQR